MEMNLLEVLSPEEKDRYNRLAQLFAQPGWSDLQLLYETLANQAKEAGANALNWEDNRIALGLRRAYAEFANLADSVEDQYSSLATEKLLEYEATYEDDYE